MIKLSDLLDVIEGEFVGDLDAAQDITFNSISTDSRSVGVGQLFIALSGEHFDAHDYLAQVKEKGACAAIVSRSVDVDLPQILVADTLEALGKIGAYMASLTKARFVGLTGSCGKTTTKEMIKLVLSSEGQVHATRGNLNNHIGVPLTLSEVSGNDDFAVIEMGASGLDEIKYTVSMADPEVVLLTNASAAHLEGFGSLENIVQAKGEIIRYAPQTATAVLNMDDPHYHDWVGMLSGRKHLSFSHREESGADVRLLSKQTLLPQGYQLEVDVQGNVYSVELHVMGEHMIQNVLATLAVVKGLKLNVEQAAKNLSKFEAVKGRFCPTKTRLCTIWDDAYNANPESVKAALTSLADTDKPRWLVLGNMAELGELSEQAHAEMGSFAELRGFEKVYAIGAYASAVVEGKSFSGTAYKKTDKDVLISDLKKDISVAADSELQILIKGSRSAGMDQVVQALLEWSGD